MSALNPNHPVTQAVHDQWHKIVALLMVRMGEREVAISPGELTEALESIDGHAVTIRFDDVTGIELKMVDAIEAARIARAEGGLPS